MTRPFLSLVVLLVLPALLLAQAPPLEKEIVYGTGGGQNLLLDVCRPTRGTGPYPVVICIHGGAWRAGHRAAHHATVKMLAEQGFVAATISYRLAPQAVWPAQLEDSKCAVRFLRTKAKDWNLDPDRIAVLGDSAGGHLSLLVGLMDGAVGFEGKGGHEGVPSKVQAVVNYYGPTDFLTWKLPALGESLLKLGSKKDSAQILTEFLGTSDRNAPVMKVVSPLTYVGKNNPPVLTFNGTADPLVPDQQARVLHEALNKENVPNRLEILQDASHGWGQPLRDRTNRITLEFLKSSLKK